MIKVTIEGTHRNTATEGYEIDDFDDDRVILELLRDRLCYGLTDEMSLRVKSKGWTGHSGGEDAYFMLSDRKVEVIVK